MSTSRNKPDRILGDDAPIPPIGSAAARRCERLIVVLGLPLSGVNTIALGLDELQRELLSRDPVLPDPQATRPAIEARDIGDINRRLLELDGLGWDRIGRSSPSSWERREALQWRLDAIQSIAEKGEKGSFRGLAAPGTARVLPFWQGVFDALGLSARYVIALRNPLSLAKALQHTYGMSIEKASLLWLQEVAAAVSHTSRHPCVVVDYDLLASDPVPQFRRLAANLELEIPDSIPRFDAATQETGGPSLPGSTLDAHPAFGGLTKRVYELLQKAARDHCSLPALQAADDWLALERFLDEFNAFVPCFQDQEHRLEQALAENIRQNGCLAEQAERLARHAARIAELEGAVTASEAGLRDSAQQLAAAHNTLAQRTAEFGSLERLAADQRDELAALHASTSWRITRPMRSARRALHRVRPLLGAWARALYAAAPIPIRWKMRLNRIVFATLGPLFKHTEAYRAWAALDQQDDNRREAAPHELASATPEGIAPDLGSVFDGAWYLRTSPEAAANGADPLEHYLEHGASSGRDPHPLFDTRYYIAQHPELSSGRENPLRHYLEVGANTGSDPHPLFWGDYYRKASANLGAVSGNPLIHYLQIGRIQHKPANPLFDPSWYLETYPDVAESDCEPMTHYLTRGICEGLDPSPAFSSIRYLELHPEVAESGTNPLAHLLERARTGSDEGPVPPLRLWFRDLYASGRSRRPTESSSNPKVSVIIPCYNQGRYLEEAVLSAFLATSETLEIIIVDDGSTEPETLDELQRIANSYDVILIRQKNGGLSAARNAALSRATGDYIQFLDADDILLAGKMDRQIEAFDHDETLMVNLVDYAFCDELLGNWSIPEPSTVKGFPFSRPAIITNWERDLSIPIHCALFRRVVIDGLTFSTKVGAKEDWLFWLDVAGRTDRCEFIDEVLVLYRQHGASMKTRFDVMGREFLKAAMIACENEPEPELLDNCLRHYRRFYAAGNR